MHTMSPQITACSKSDFEQIKNYIQKFELDNRELKASEFLVLHINEQLAGFGRVRAYSNFYEMCSLGIITEQRQKGLGKLLVKALEQKATGPIYIVTIIPHYFTHFGFKICRHYPAEISNKLTYCEQGLPVEEKYVVMCKIPAL